MSEKLLNELRVIDLRAELEKRDLDKNGVRGALIQRLTEYLVKEGHDPATYKFDLSDSDPKTPMKRTRKTASSVEAPAEETPAVENMVVQEDAGEGEETDKAITESEQAASPRKREHSGPSDDTDEATDAKKPCLADDRKNEMLEDSINLDIGEDEMLNEETERASKFSKDDGDAVKEDAATPAQDDAAAEHSAASTDAGPAEAQQSLNDASTTSNDGETAGKDANTNEEKNKGDDADKEKKKDDGKEGGPRNLWVSGLSSDTRAKDLKQLCSKHGKVIGAKIVTNARTPGSRCYGYVTMASSQDAENCIKNLHRTELHGRMISVEKAKSETESSSRRQTSRPDRREASRDRKDDGKENQAAKDDKDDGKAKKESGSGAESHRSRSGTREKSHRSDRKERDVARARDRSRAAREEERRRRAAEEALRERERRQRQEKHRLALEREKLRAEREKIEREKNELLKLERERHKLEREKLELERLELKRAQLRLEEERRKRSYDSGPGYRKPASSPPAEPAYDRDARHKRAPPPPLSSSRGQFEAPPPPRFEMSSGYDRGSDKRDRDRDYKRGDYSRHVSSGNMKYASNGSSNDDSRQPMPPGTRPKEPSRSYESRDSRSYRPSSPSKPESRSWNSSSRYPDATASKGSGGGSTETWSASDTRYGSGSYEARYAPAYQPPPPGAPYPDRYAPPARDYRKY